jgi:hypothetical protein
MIIPAIIIVCLTGGTAYTVHKRSKKPKIAGMTPERQRLYEALINHQKDPKKLRKMADKFETEGLIEQATKLRKLAAIKELPEEKKAERREIFRKGMISKNRDAIFNVATQFDEDGCPGAAAALRKYAAGLAPISETSVGTSS